MGSSYLNDVVALLLKNGFEQIKDGDAIVSSYFPSKDMTDKIRKAIDEAYASPKFQGRDADFRQLYTKL
ncbi:Uncharacterised protein [Anaerobiospirillum thomasii]|uniref:hypothetical protein n=1 Tax=Anaerobiospirillum thomasii TaxID=179995 RepID=UPI000D97C948|nr:hypothetical protein [Anaerobiospirillum thomasii]SPT67679.1 Uncharacterised protein [Anaerobiospirillum thomasii]